MKVPNQLKIGGHVYSIVRAPIPNNQMGETDYRERIITLDSGLKGSSLGATLLHEILHACNGTLGDSEVGHALLDSLSEQLYAVLADNGLLVEEMPVLYPIEAAILTN